MRKILCGGLCVLFLCSVSVAQKGKQQPKPKPAPTAAELKAKIAKLRNTYSDVFRKQIVLRRKLEQSKEFQALRDKSKEADAAMRKASAKRLAANKDKMAKIEAEYRKVINKKIADSKEIPALQKEIDEFVAKKTKFSYAIAVADLKLRHRDSPIAQAVAKDPRLAVLKQGMDRGNFAARSAYLRSYKKVFDDHPAVKKLRAELEQMRQDYKGMDKSLRTMQTKLSAMTRRIEFSKDKEIQDARKTYTKARAALFRGGQTKQYLALVKAATQARTAMIKGTRELIANNQELAQLKAQQEDLMKQIRALETQRRKLLRKKQ